MPDRSSVPDDQGEKMLKMSHGCVFAQQVVPVLLLPFC